MSQLNLEKALIFRITHITNVPWLLDHGLHARNSPTFDPNFRNIGNLDLISRRHLRIVPIAPYGTLSDYVPFYFTPYYIMLLNIKTGYGNTPHVPNDDIVILVSSLLRIAEMGLPFVFTNQHAYPVTAEYFNSLDDLDRVDWPLLRARDFKHDPEDPGKKERYQAEALIHEHVPLEALEGIVCSNREAEMNLHNELQIRNLSLRLLMKPSWYFL